MTDDELKALLFIEPTLLGFCIGVPSSPCGKRIYDSDLLAIQAPGFGVLGTCCWSRLLFGGRSWTDQLGKAAPSRTAAGKKAGAKAKLRATNIRLPGSRLPRTQERGRTQGSPRPPEGTKTRNHWRGYPV